MKILTIETSGKLCGVSISENEKILDKLELNNGLTHSESLMPLINNILKNNNFKISDFDAFVCDIGPGSFTGIRIGVATIKAFVDCSKNVQYTGVSSLEALAYNVKSDGLICSVIDAKNFNCYYALYDFKNECYNEIIPPSATSIFEMFEELKKHQYKTITFVGDGAISYQGEIKSNIPNSYFLSINSNNISTSNLAICGYNRLSSNNTLDLTPMYLKKPQAQRQLEEKNKKD